MSNFSDKSKQLNQYNLYYYYYYNNESDNTITFIIVDILKGRTYVPSTGGDGIIIVFKRVQFFYVYLLFIMNI